MYTSECIVLINQSINFIVCLGTYAQIHQTIYTFSAEWKNVPLLALLQEMCDPHRGVAGDQIRHGISFPKKISRIKSGNFILWAIKHGMMLTIYMLDTCIANLRFVWQPLKAAPYGIAASADQI